jgi:hypothetical protein
VKYWLAFLACLLTLPAYSAGLFLLAVAPSGGGCSQATTYLTAVGSQPTNYTNAMTTLICGGVTDGWWAKLDAFYFLKAHTSATALVNAKQPGTYNASAVAGTSGPTFTVDVGYTGISTTTDYITSNFNASTAGSANFTLNAASWGASASAASAALCGLVGNGSYLDSYFSGKSYLAMNGAANINVSAPGTLTGTWIGVQASAAVTLYQAGSSIVTGSDSVTSLANANITFLSDSDGSSCGWTITTGFFGGGLTSTDVTNITSRIATYQSSVP